MTKFCFSIALLIFSSLGFAEQQTWYFVRHFEKQQGDNPSLTEVGKAKAEALSKFFSDKPLKHVYSTQYRRTQQTASPVAASKLLQVEKYDPTNLPAFAEQLATQSHVLIVGHSNTTPNILALMGGETIQMSEADYGVLFKLQKDGDKFTTTQTIISD